VQSKDLLVFEVIEVVAVFDPVLPIAELVEPGGWERFDLEVVEDLVGKVVADLTADTADWPEAADRPGAAD